jgi:hypothetical protein
MRSRGAWCFVLVLLAATPRQWAGAQSWNSARALTLVRQATDRRVQQLADSGLLDYRASAHGYLTFLAQLGEGFRAPPRVVKADELALEVYWRAPNLSKQRIVGRRDTTLLPTDIAYHRDHLGIVQNNFPAIIRIGDGDEVRDVPHPLSEDGLREYQFALADSLRITIPGRVIDVYEVRVRPVDDRQPRIAGALYIERGSAQVVRMAFGFTRAAYLDKQLEDVFVVLENGLVGTRFWLPRRQEVEIRRVLTWMDYPVRGIIRGRWEIGDYTLNVDSPPTTFVGPEIVEAPGAVMKSHVWGSGRLVDSLPPESRLPTPTEIRRVQDDARALVRQQAVAGHRGALSARGASDVLRFDRNSGLSPGAGFTARLGRGFQVSARGRYGVSDARGRGMAEFGWQTVHGAGLSVRMVNDTRDVGDAEERSGLVNSLAAQEFGSDFSDRYGIKTLGVAATLVVGSTRWTADAALEHDSRLSVLATPFAGTFRAAFDPEGGMNVGTASLRVDRSTAPAPLGFEWRGLGELRASRASAPGDALLCPGSGGPCYGDGHVRRGMASIELERQIADARLVSRSYAAAVFGDHFLRAQDLVFLGGPVSAPGFHYHELVGDRAVTQHTELVVPVPFPRLSLGRFGRMPGRALLAPHWSLVGLHRVSLSQAILRGPVAPGGSIPLRPRPSGWYHSAGVSVVTFFDLLRFDVSRELPTGRWMFSADVSRTFWPIL